MNETNAQLDEDEQIFDDENYKLIYAIQLSRSLEKHIIRSVKNMIEMEFVKKTESSIKFEEIALKYKTGHRINLVYFDYVDAISAYYNLHSLEFIPK